MSLLKPRKQQAAAMETGEALPVVEDRMLRIAEVASMVGLGRSTIYTLIRNGKFPVQRKRTARASVWLLSEVQAYIRGEYVPPQNEPVNILKLVRNSSGVKA